MNLGQTCYLVCLQYTFFPKSLRVICFDSTFYFVVLWEDNWIQLGISRPRWSQMEHLQKACKLLASRPSWGQVALETAYEMLLQQGQRHLSLLDLQFHPAHPLLWATKPSQCWRRAISVQGVAAKQLDPERSWNSQTLLRTNSLLQEGKRYFLFTKPPS